MRWIAYAISTMCLGLVAISVQRCASTDMDIEVARARILAMTPDETARLVAFCRSWHMQNGERVWPAPPPLPAHWTSTNQSSSRGFEFTWWNNSHMEESTDHPGFELVCTTQPQRDGKQLAPGLWYVDTPLRAE